MVMRFSIRCGVFSLVALLLVRYSATAADDAEILSRRIPNQSFYLGETTAFLERGDITWVIRLWACDPADLAIIKVLGGSPPAPYAIKITPTGDNPIGALDHVGRLRTVHLLAASLADAVKMRRALIVEINATQRRIETRQGNAPGYLKRLVQSQKR
jgi:hypothetical protein